MKTSNKYFHFTTALLVVSIVGCTSVPMKTQIADRVDPISITDRVKYEHDIMACEQLAQKRMDERMNEQMGEMIIGALIGAAFGAAIAPGGYRGYGAQVGAVSGTAYAMGGAMSKTMNQFDVLVANCLINRGYKILY